MLNNDLISVCSPAFPAAWLGTPAAALFSGVVLKIDLYGIITTVCLKPRYFSAQARYGFVPANGILKNLGE